LQRNFLRLVSEMPLWWFFGAVVVGCGLVQGDTEPPRIDYAASFPAPGATGVSPHAVVTVAFSEPVVPSNGFFLITEYQAGAPTGRSWQGIVTGDVATHFTLNISTPPNSWEPGYVYSVEASHEHAPVKDLAGNALAGLSHGLGQSWAFLVASSSEGDWAGHSDHSGSWGAPSTEDSTTTVITTPSSSSSWGEDITLDLLLSCQMQIGLNGEEACENHNYNQAQCMAVGCCLWSSGGCYSDVHDQPCTGCGRQLSWGNHHGGGSSTTTPTPDGSTTTPTPSTNGSSNATTTVAPTNAPDAQVSGAKRGMVSAGVGAMLLAAGAEL